MCLNMVYSDLRFIIFYILIGIAQTSHHGNQMNWFDLQVNFRAIDVNFESLTEICAEDISVLLRSLKSGEKWATEFFDSAAKSTSGILFGEMFQLGNIDECIQAKQLPSHVTGKSAPISGKYCLADVTPELKNDGIQTTRCRWKFNTTLHWGVCVPSTCSHRDVKILLENLFNKTALDSVSVNLDEKKCSTEKSLPLTTFELIYGSMLVAILMLVAIATVFNFTVCNAEKNDTITFQLLMCFSFPQNVKQIFATNSNDLSNCICGIKVLSMVLIVWGHAFLSILAGPVANIEFYEKTIMRVESAFFLNGGLFPDTFLLLSGFLWCRSLLDDLEKRNGEINLFKRCIGRYVRLTPTYAAIVGFYCTFFVRFGNGPLWNSLVLLERERCLQSWWANLLYINNYVNTQHICGVHFWHLAADTQMFLATPILAYVLWKWPKLGQIIFGHVIIVTIVIPFAYTYQNRMDPTFLAFAPEFVDPSTNFYLLNVHFKTHMHAISYCLGLFFAYVVHRQQVSRKRLCLASLVAGWMMAAFCALSSIFWVTVFYSPEYEYDVIEASLYSSLHRVGWCLGIGWVLFCCLTDNGGLVNKFLSWQKFAILSNLTYSTYLTHGIVLMYFSGSLRHPIHLGIFNLVFILISLTFMSVVLAFFVSVLFEFPFIRLKNLYLNKTGAKLKIK